MTSTPSLLPSSCYFCQQPARIQPGRNSYLVECDHCGIRYEMDLTAWTVDARYPSQVLAWIRQQQAGGHEWPYVTKQQVDGTDTSVHSARAK